MGFGPGLLHCFCGPSPTREVTRRLNQHDLERVRVGEIDIACRDMSRLHRSKPLPMYIIQLQPRFGNKALGFGVLLLSLIHI